MRTPLICLLIVALAATVAQAESLDLAAFNTTRVARNEHALLVLAGWGALSLVAGGWGAARTSGDTRAFWGMNLGWGAINLAIAGLGYRGLAALDPQALTLAATLEEAHGLERLVALNLGLDVAYLVAGWALRERGLRTESATLRGFGSAVAAQGAFLLVFDAVLLAINVGADRALFEAVR